MLVLSRGKSEAIRIGKHGEITIVILSIRGDKVRIGISASKSIPVFRHEVWTKLRPAPPRPYQNRVELVTPNLPPGSLESMNDD